MTIAISVKVNDGLVLASDSASTLMERGSTQVIQVFNNAAKIFNLRKSLPIGMMTWGAGSIGRAAISTLAKDLRQRFTEPDQAHQDWHLDTRSYTMGEVAKQVRRFMYEEHYLPAFGSWAQKPRLGFMVAGYSPGALMAEEFLIEVDDQGQCADPIPFRTQDTCGASWHGQPEAITRLLIGICPQLGDALVKLGVDPAQLPVALKEIQKATEVQVVYDPMPIQDAIDLAEFLVDLTEGFSRYTPGAATVGGPIEIAAITKHEGFKWVKRKHYFRDELNPE